MVPTMSREEMIAQVEWASGGYGSGNMASAMAWEMSRPGPDLPDLVSIVALYGPPEKYTDEELAKIVEFAQEVTARYDRIFKVRLGANMILLDKPNWLPQGKWLRKRMSWKQGPMHSGSLDEALEIMRRN